MELRFPVPLHHHHHHHHTTTTTTPKTCSPLTAFVVVMTSLLMMTSHVRTVTGHGRLMDPPARNSMWRLGFNNPVNYNDNEQYCGGRMVQWIRNGGKCGVCGDAYHKARDHEAGGKYANAIITRTYRQGDVMPITVHLTANHQGWFEIRVCPVNDPKKAATQECLDQHVLRRVDDGSVQFPVPKGKYNAFFNYSVQLPPDLTCSQCVVQWKYRTGNTWDKDDNSGVFCLGCGPQEEFYNCADIAILPDKKNAIMRQKNKRVPNTNKAQSSPKNDGRTATKRQREETATTKKDKELQKKRDAVKGYVNRNLSKPKDDRYSWHAGSSFNWLIASREAETSRASPFTATTTTFPTTTITTTTSHPRNPFTPPLWPKRPSGGFGSKKRSGIGNKKQVFVRTGPNRRRPTPREPGGARAPVPSWLMHLTRGRKPLPPRADQTPTVTSSRQDNDPTARAPISIEDRRQHFRRRLWRHLSRSTEKKQNDAWSNQLRNTVKSNSGVEPTRVTPTCDTSSSDTSERDLPRGGMMQGSSWTSPQQSPSDKSYKGAAPTYRPKKATPKRRRYGSDNSVVYNRRGRFADRNPGGFSRNEYYRRDVPRGLYSDGNLQYRRGPVTQLYRAMQPVSMGKAVALDRSGGAGWWQGYNDMVWAPVPPRQQSATGSLHCRASVQLGGGMDEWCMVNCNSNYCPESMCVCQPSQSSVEPSYSLLPASHPSWIQPYRQVPHTPYRNLPSLHLPMPERRARSRSVFTSPLGTMFRDDSRLRNPLVVTYSPYLQQQQQQQQQQQAAESGNIHAGERDADTEQQRQSGAMLPAWGRPELSERNYKSQSLGDAWGGKSGDRTPPGRGEGMAGWGQSPEIEAGYDGLDVITGLDGERRVCLATGFYTGMASYDTWCRNNCAQAMCPQFLCTCQTL